jgi:hypothetical protein
VREKLRSKDNWEKKTNERDVRKLESNRGNCEVRGKKLR